MGGTDVRAGSAVGSDQKDDNMSRLLKLAVMGMICMPIGGVRACGPVAEAMPMATAAPVANPWLVAPMRLVIVCVVLLLASWVNRYYRRQLFLVDRGKAVRW